MIFTAVALSFIPVMTMYGPEAALIARLSLHDCATAAPRLVISRPRLLPADLPLYRDLAVRNL